MIKIISLLITVSGSLYSQCDDLLEIQCHSNSSCEWVENIQTGWCGNLNNASACYQYDNCHWSCQGGWYLGNCYGTYGCGGGYYQADNSYCELLPYTPGDTNGDGYVNISDVVIMVEYVLNEEYDYYCDVNSDGMLNVVDIVETIESILNN